MERIIKFRGKRTDNGEWVYGDLIQLDTQLCIAGSHQWATALQNNSLELGVDEVIPETIGQLTGLKDKNGVEIYEGDILYYRYDDEMEDDILYYRYYDEMEDDGYGEVYYDVVFKYGAFGVIGEITNEFLPFSDNPIITEVVAGNIHDNPELLEL